MNTLNPVVHESYDISKDFTCYLCKLPIPTNIFRGAIEGKCNKLALQYDHVIPKSANGLDIASNMKPTHRYCNGSKNKYTWSLAKEKQAYELVRELLKNHSESSWLTGRLSDYCIVDLCESKARAGDYWTYCVKHAKTLGENTRVIKCQIADCSKQARSSSEGHCQSHAREFNINYSYTKCREETCEKQVQHNKSKIYCQSHARAKGLVNKPVNPGIKEAAAHASKHKKASRSCFFCVVVENRCDFLDETFAISVIESMSNPTVRKVMRTLRIDRRAALHFMEKVEACHESSCKYCLLQEELSQFYL